MLLKIIAAVVVVLVIAAFAHFKGNAQREVEFRRAFRQKCLEDERDGLA